MEVFASDQAEWSSHGQWAMGYWGYDLKDQLERLADRATREWDLPDALWLIFDSVLSFNHTTQEWSQFGKDARTASAWQSVPDECLREPRRDHHYSVRSQMSKDDYLRAVSDIRKRIAQGDVYEVNFTQRFHVDISDYDGRDADVMEALLAVTPSPFSAMIRTPELSVLSSSMERFLRIEGSRLSSEPIKGTRPRGRTFDEDEDRFLSLTHSAKDRAENLMIVDLTRNDLGRVAEPGSVRVPRLFGIDRYETVFQMSSTIEAVLQNGRGWADALQAAFPPGSMTGAPKIAAMNVIEELEPVKRQIYSGALGYIAPDGTCDLSVIIRTLILQGNRGYFQTGGAIVWDSDPETEFEECQHKARGILDSLQRWSEVSVCRTIE